MGNGIIRDTFWKQVKFLRNIRDRQIARPALTSQHQMKYLQLKFCYYEVKFWDYSIQNSGKLLEETSLKSTLSLIINGNCVYICTRLHKLTSLTLIQNQTHQRRHDVWVQTDSYYSDDEGLLKFEKLKIEYDSLLAKQREFASLISKRITSK